MSTDVDKNVVSHLAEVNSFWAMEVLARARKLEREGRDIIHFEVGEPDFATPEKISQAGIDAIKDGKTLYTDSRGIQEFRDAVVNKYRRKYGVNFSSSQIVTSAGSSLPLYLAMRMLVPAGGELIVTDPCYPCYRNLSILGNIELKRVKLHLENGFKLDIDDIKKAITKKTRAILINSPMNPTGTIIDPAGMKELAALGIPIISDEIYSDLIYEGRVDTMLRYTDNCIVLNGMSKYYAMTGWRLGYMILPDQWSQTAAKLHQNIMLSAGQFVQEAGVVALNDAEDDCEKMRIKFDERRLHMLKRLKGAGLDPQYTPTGAFYMLFKYPDQSRKSLDVSLDILNKVGVAITPGIDFGPGGEGFLRFSYANSLENIDRAVISIGEYFQ